MNEFQEAPQNQTHQGQPSPKDNETDNFWSLYKQWQVLSDQFEKNSVLMTVGWNPKSGPIPSEDLAMLDQMIEIAERIIEEVNHSTSD